MPDGVPKGFDCLPGEVSAATAAPVRGDNERDLNASRFSKGVYGKKRGFAVKRIHDGLKEEEVCTAINQAFRLRRVSRDEL